MVGKVIRSSSFLAHNPCSKLVKDKKVLSGFSSGDCWYSVMIRDNLGMKNEKLLTSHHPRISPFQENTQQANLME